MRTIHQGIYLLFFSSLFWWLPGSSLAKNITLSTAQFEIEGDLSNKAFFAKVSRLTEDAAKKGTQILVMPEWNTLDRWPKKGGLSDRDIVEMIADETTAPYIKLLSKLAKKHQMLIVGGSTALRQSQAIYNAAPIVFPDGKVYFHRKVHLTSWERKQNLAAGDGPTVLDTPYGKIAVLVCYDSEFPDLSLKLMASRPEIIIVPSMTESKAGERRVRWATQGRVVEQTAYAAIAVTAGNPLPDWHHHGRAVVLAPQLPVFKPILAEGDGTSHGLTTAVIDLDALRKQRTTSQWQPAADWKKTQADQ